MLLGFLSAGKTTADGRTVEVISKGAGGAFLGDRGKNIDTPPR